MYICFNCRDISLVSSSTKCLLTWNYKSFHQLKLPVDHHRRRSGRCFYNNPSLTAYLPTYIIIIHTRMLCRCVSPNCSRRVMEWSYYPGIQLDAADCVVGRWAKLPEKVLTLAHFAGCFWITSINWVVAWLLLLLHSHNHSMLCFPHHYRLSGSFRGGGDIIANCQRKPFLSAINEDTLVFICLQN